MTNKPRLVLGIETSCDETAAAVVREGRDVLSNVIASQHDLHAEYGGVVPEIASRAHAERLLPIVQEALRIAGAALEDVACVAVGCRPGLIGSLLVGVSGGKGLAWSLGVPLVGVDHVHAHVYSGLLGPQCGAEDHVFPALGLVLSGGHTSLYRVDSFTKLTRLGSTRDDAMGEAFDKAAAILGLGHPGGPAIDRLASEPGANDHAHDFPIARIAPASLDFSFSGLKTAVLYAARGVPVDGAYPREIASLSHAQRRDIAASFQRAAVDTVTLKLRRAMAHGPFRALLTGGGVVSNTRLRAALADFAVEHDTRLVIPPPPLCVDNAAMIAGLGFHQWREVGPSDLSLSASPTGGR